MSHDFDLESILGLKVINAFHEGVSPDISGLALNTVEARESVVDPALTAAFDVGEAIIIPPTSKFYKPEDDVFGISDHTILREVAENPSFSVEDFQERLARYQEASGEYDWYSSGRLSLGQRERSIAPELTVYEDTAIQTMYTIQDLYTMNPFTIPVRDLQQSLKDRLEKIVQCDDKFCPQLRSTLNDTAALSVILAFPDAWAKFRQCLLRTSADPEKIYTPEICDSILIPYLNRSMPMVMEELASMRKSQSDTPLIDYDGFDYPSPFWFQGVGDVWRRSNHGDPNPTQRCEQITEKFQQCIADPTMPSQTCYDHFHEHKACQAGVNCRYLRVPLARCMIKNSRTIDYEGSNECYHSLKNYDQCVIEPTPKPLSVDIDVEDYIVPTDASRERFRYIYGLHHKMALREPYEIKMHQYIRRARELCDTKLFLGKAESLFYLKHKDIPLSQARQLAPHYNLRDHTLNPYDENFYSDSFTLADANFFEMTGYEMKLRREHMIQKFELMAQNFMNEGSDFLYHHDDDVELELDFAYEYPPGLVATYNREPKSPFHLVDWGEYRYNHKIDHANEGFRNSKKKVYAALKKALLSRYPMGGTKQPHGPSVKQIYYYDTYWNAYFAYQPFTRTSYPFFPISHLYHYQDFNFDVWDEKDVLHFPPYPRYTSFNESIHPYFVAKDELLFDKDKRLDACDGNTNLDMFNMQTGIYFGNPQLDGGKVLDHFRMYFAKQDKYYTCYDLDTRCIPSRYPGDNYGTFYDERLNTNWFYRPDTHEYYSYDANKDRIVYNLHNRTTHRYGMDGRVEYLCEQDQIDTIYFFQRKLAEFQAEDRAILERRSDDPRDNPFFVDHRNNPLLLEQMDQEQLQTGAEIPNNDQFDAYEFVDTRTTPQVEGLITLPLPPQKDDPTFLDRVKSIFNYQQFNWLRKTNIMGEDTEIKFSDHMQGIIHRENQAKKEAYQHLQHGQTYKYRKYLRFGTYDIDKRDATNIDTALTTYFHELPYLQSPYFKMYKKHPPPRVAKYDPRDQSSYEDYAVDRSSLLVKAFRERHNMTYKEYLEYILFCKHIEQQLKDLIEYEKFNEQQKLLEFIEFKQQQVKETRLTYSEKIRRQQELYRRFGRVAPDFTKYGNVFGYNPHTLDTEYELPHPNDVFHPKRAPFVKFYVDE